MSHPDWLIEAHLSHDDRTALESIASWFDKNEAVRVDPAAARLEAFAGLNPPNGVLDLHADRTLINQLCCIWQTANGRRDMPPSLQRLWDPRPRTGRAWFPVSDGDQHRVMEIEVGLGLTDSIQHQATFTQAIDAARRWVIAHLAVAGPLLSAVGWRIHCPPAPLRGGSVFIAAVVALSSYALHTPPPAGLAFTGAAPSRARPSHCSPVSHHATKLEACAQHAAIQRLYVPQAERWPVAEAACTVLPAGDLLDLMRSLFQAPWHTVRRLAANAMPTPAPAQPVLSTLRQNLRAVLAEASHPLSTDAVFAALRTMDWHEFGGLQLNEVLGNDDPVIQLDDHRWCLLQLDAADAQRRSQVESASLASAAPGPLATSRRAFAALRTAPHRAQLAGALNKRGCVPLRRLGLSLLLLDATPPLAALAESVVADADSASTILALQAVAELALYMLAAPALRDAEDHPEAASTKTRNVLAKLTERPSLGRLAEAARHNPKLNEATRSSLSAIPKLLNGLLHHFGGWQTLAHTTPDIWQPGAGAGYQLLVHTQTLVAVCDPTLGADGRWVRPQGAHFECYRGLPDGVLRWWRFDRQALSTTTLSAWPNVAVDQLPGPLAHAAARAKGARKSQDWLATAAALDRVIALWLRLAAAHNAQRWLAKSLHFTRPTKRSLLHLAEGSPMLPDSSAVSCAINRLERLEHHPGPVSGAFALEVDHAGCAVFAALKTLTKHSVSLIAGTTQGSQTLRGFQPQPSEMPCEPGTLSLLVKSRLHPLWSVVARASDDGAVELLIAAKSAKAIKGATAARRLKQARYARIEGEKPGLIEGAPEMLDARQGPYTAR